MRDANGNFVDMLGDVKLDPFWSGCAGGVRGAMFPNAPKATPAAIESSSAMLAEKHKIENWSDKRLVQTSPPYPSAFEALDACAGNRTLENCEYAYVTEDHRVVGIYSYYDVTPDKPVMKGQKRVIIPMEQKVNVSYVQMAKVAQASGLSWSTADDLGNVIKKIKTAHPDAVVNAETTYAGKGGERTRQLNLTIILKD